MKQRIKELEERVGKLEADLAKVSYWFTDRPESEPYVNGSAIAFRAYLDTLEAECESEAPTLEPPANTR